MAEKLEKAEERNYAPAVERVDKVRATTPDERTDATGRVLYPWEVSPKEQVVMVQVEETKVAGA